MDAYPSAIPDDATLLIDGEAFSPAHMGLQPSYDDADLNFSATFEGDFTGLLASHDFDDVEVGFPSSTLRVEAAREDVFIGFSASPDYSGGGQNGNGDLSTNLIIEPASVQWNEPRDD